jgi:hypothetical protein
MMTDPVIAKDGHTYEKSAIEDCFVQSDKLGRGATSPKTGGAIGKEIIWNFAIKALVEERRARESRASAGTGTGRSAGARPVRLEETGYGSGNGNGVDEVGVTRQVQPALAGVLKRLNLQQYAATFAEEGYDELGDVHYLTVKELMEGVGMKKGHAKRLARHFSTPGAQ